MMLEGNNFLISILLTIVLSGIIVFYFRQQINTLENKLTSMFQLIQSITSELQKINGILVKDEDLNEQFDQNEEEFHDTQCNLDEQCPVIQHSSEVPHVEIHAVQITPLQENMQNNNTEQESDVKIVELNNDDGNESESEEESELETDSDNEEDVELEVVKQDHNEKIEIKDDSKKLNLVDYNKLKVGELRKIIEEKGLVTDAKNLKKKEMIELLG